MDALDYVFETDVAVTKCTEWRLAAAKNTPIRNHGSGAWTERLASMLSQL